MSWPQRSESCNTERKLSASDSWGHCDTPPWSKGLHNYTWPPSRPPLVIITGGVCYSESHQLQNRSASTQNARAYWGRDGCWGGGRRFYCSWLWWHVWRSGSGSWQKSSDLPPKVQRKKCSPKPREAQAATATSALHWTHGYCSGTENRPRQSSSYCWDANPYRQARSTMSSGIGPVPRQISPTSLQYNQTFKGLNTVWRTVGLERTSTDCIWEAKGMGLCAPQFWVIIISRKKLCYSVTHPSPTLEPRWYRMGSLLPMPHEPWHRPRHTMPKLRKNSGQ